MAWLGRISRERRKGRGTPLSELGSSARVVRLARTVLAQLPRAHTNDSAARHLIRHFATVYRSLGVSLAPADGGLEHLDAYVLAPLRDAAFVSVLLFDREIDEVVRGGMDFRRALALTSATWAADFGGLLVQAERRQRDPDSSPLSRDDTVSTGGFNRMHGQPPHVVVRERALEAVRRDEHHNARDPFAQRDRELRVKERLDGFEVQGVSLSGGAAAREARRVVFVTTLIVTDDIHYKTLKATPEELMPIYRETIVRLLAGTARLVCDYSADTG